MAVAHKILTKDGEERIISWQTTGIYDDEDSIEGYSSSLQKVVDKIYDMLLANKENFPSI